MIKKLRLKCDFNCCEYYIKLNIQSLRQNINIVAKVNNKKSRKLDRITKQCVIAVFGKTGIYCSEP